MPRTKAAAATPTSAPRTAYRRSSVTVSACGVIATIVGTWNAGWSPKNERPTKVAAPEATALELRAASLDLNFHQLDGNIGVLANGAGLTMATLDMVRHAGGAPANFLEIGGDAYTRARPALELLLDLPGLRAVVVNFCGAYARTEVMAAGVADAWQALSPSIPVFFSIHGTGEDEAVALVREQLGIEPFDRAEDAVKAAVEAAR